MRLQRSSVSSWRDAWRGARLGAAVGAGTLALFAALAIDAAGCSSPTTGRALDGGSSSPGATGSSGGGSSGGGSGGSSSGSPTGGGTTSCGFNYTTTTCAACNTQSCCSQEQACSGDTSCATLLNCLIGCSGNSTCATACENAATAAAINELSAALTCTNNNCATPCGIATDAGTPAPADAGCGTTPTVHPGVAGSIFCGYSAGTAFSCTQQQCCLGGALGGGAYAPEVCAALGSTCTNSGSPDAGGTPAVPIACMQVSDCTADGVSGAVSCCLQGATGSPAIAPGCTYYKATGGTAITCETSACAVGETAICTTQADCPAGKTCTPGKWKLYQVGFCL